MADSNQHNDPQESAEGRTTRKPFSLTRLPMLLILVVLAALAGSYFAGSYLEDSAREDLEKRTLAHLLGK